MRYDAKRSRVACAMQVLSNQSQAITQERVGVGMRPEEAIVGTLGVPDLYRIAYRQDRLRNLMFVSAGVCKADNPPRLTNLRTPACYLFIRDPAVDAEGTEVKPRPVLLVARDEHACIDRLAVSNESPERILVKVFVVVRNQNRVEPLARGKICKVLRR